MTDPSANEDLERQEKPPQSEAEVRAWHESNRQGWNEGAIHYTDRMSETIDFLRAGKSNLHPIERRNLEKLGKLSDWCRFAVHLQCASGMDTLSLWNEGVARVAGVDISDRHISNARQISAALNAPADWYRCDILDTPAELNGTADLVYTGRGALCWLHDLEGWGRVIARLLKPGGILHVFDDHPVDWLFDAEAAELKYSGANYFHTIESGVGWPATYIGDTIGIPLEQQARKYERLWTLAEIFNAVRSAGLVVEYLGEHAENYWDSHPNLLPEHFGKIPLTFSLLARKAQE
jgi:SAM-dependent methyltransferase